MAYAESDSEAQAMPWRSGRSSKSSGGLTAATSESTLAGRRSTRNLMQRFAKELVALQPDLILSHSTPTTAALLQQTRTIPAFLRSFTIRSAAASSLACHCRAGNATGFTNLESSWRQVARAAQGDCAARQPSGFLYNPATATYAEYYLNPFKAAAASWQCRHSPHLFATHPNLNPFIAAQAREPDSGMFVMSDSFTSAIAWRLRRWLLASVCPPPIRSVSLLSSVGCWPMEMTDLIRFDARRLMRSHSQGREAERASRSGPGLVRAGDQSKDSQALGLDVPLQLQQRADEVIE